MVEDEDDDEEDDAFFDSDGYMDTESVFDDMDVEEDLNDISMHEGEVGIWDGQAADASMENLGLSSDGDI